jgi:hypothetical protein
VHGWVGGWIKGRRWGWVDGRIGGWTDEWVTVLVTR